MDSRRPRQDTQGHDVFDDFLRTFRDRPEARELAGEDGVTVEGLLSLPPAPEGIRVPLVSRRMSGRSVGQFGSMFNMYNGRLCSGASAEHQRIAVLRPNYRAAPATADGSAQHGRRLLPPVAQRRHGGTDYIISIGNRRSGPPGRNGLERRRRHDRQARDLHQPFQGSLFRRRSIRLISMFGTTDNRWHRVNWFGGTPWQDKAPMDSYWTTRL